MEKAESELSPSKLFMIKAFILQQSRGTFQGIVRLVEGKGGEVPKNENGQFLR